MFRRRLIYSTTDALGTKRSRMSHHIARNRVEIFMTRLYTKSLLLAVLLLAGFVPVRAAMTITSASSASGYSGFTFTVSGYPANTWRIAWTCGANPCVNYGYRSPFAEPLAAQYAFGQSIVPPFSLPWNTFWSADGTFPVTAEAFDVNGTSLGTATQTFTDANTYPVQCTDLSPPASSLSLGTVTSGLVVATLTITGSCAGDTKTVPKFYIDGVDQKFGSSVSSTTAVWNATLDETGFMNGTHRITATWTDTTNQTSSTENGAGEPGTPVTFANGALPSQVWTTCADCFLTPGSTVTLSPKLINTDGTAAAGPG